MIKKIFCFIACFMLVLSCVFISPITANASTGQTYTYDDSEVYSDTSNLGNYAINSVESLNVEGSLIYKVNFTLNQIYKFQFLSAVSGSNSYNGNYFYFNFKKNSNSQFDLNFAFKCLTSSTGITFTYSNSVQLVVNGRNFYRRELALSSSNTYELYFSPLSLSGTYSNMKINNYLDYSSVSSTIYSENLDSFIDMNSETNFSFASWVDIFFQSSSDLTLSTFFAGFLNSSSSYNLSTLNPVSSSALLTFTYYYDSAIFSLYKDDSSILYEGKNISYLYSVVGGVGSENISISASNYFTSFYFLINRPVFRTNNTLIIYNFDYYGFISSVSSVTYQLQKGVDKYNVVYNGSLPNSSFIYVHNPKIANMLFDEYIYLYLTFNGLTGFYDINSGLFNNSFSLGFDFNFTYYNEPLVSSNGSYNFDFEKPGYVDMRFSLAPFYIPVLEAVQNALIFLLFYCPIISDILAFIHLDQFFGALFNIFSFETGNITLLGINMGSFIWACISFLIFFKLLRSFMPILWSSGKSAVIGAYSGVKNKINNYKDENLKRNQRRALEKRDNELAARKAAAFENRLKSQRSLAEFRSKYDKSR